MQEGIDQQGEGKPQDAVEDKTDNFPAKPNQPKDMTFPVNYQGRRFKTDWYSFNWLHYVEHNDSVLCHTCVTADKQGKLVSAKNKDPCFLKDGCKNWKKATQKFREHQESECHKIAVQAVIVIPTSCVDIGESLSQLHQQEKAKNRHNVVKIIQNIRFFSKTRVGLPGVIGQ